MMGQVPGYELAQWQYDRQEPPEIPYLVDDTDECEDMYDLAARMIACLIPQRGANRDKLPV